MARVYKRSFPNLWLGQPATAQNVVPTAAGLLIVPPAVGPRILYARLQNRGAIMALALVGLLPDAYWKAGQWVNSTTTYTDDTVDAQDADTNDFALETATGANDGFIVGAKVPFGALSLDITTAQAAASAVHIVEYWNGSAWIAMAATAFLKDTARSVVWPLGESLILFDPKPDWALGGSGTNVPQDCYNLRSRGTPTTGTVAGLARRIYVGEVLFSDDAVAANGFIERFSEWEGIVPPSYTMALGLAASIADEGNSLELILGN